MDPILSRTWVYRGVFALLMLVIAFAALLPIGAGTEGLPGPDLTMAFVIAWVMRRPSYAPALLVALVLLMGDFLFLRPPGLWAALGLLATEFLRQQAPAVRERRFSYEWGLAAVAILGVIAANQIVLGLFFVDRPALGSALLRGLITVAVYPAAAAITAYVFGVRKVSPSERDALGARL